MDTDPSGLIPLHVAATVGNIDLCSFLSEHRADVNTVAYKYYHITNRKLMWHSQEFENAELQVSRALIDYGANISTDDYQG